MNFLRRLFEIMAFVGFFILVGTVGTMDARPEYPLNDLVVQGVIGIILMIPMVIYERWWIDEEY